ncbi:MAG TPA: 50S ribosomal protein L25 [Candidatus Binatia bacterium]|nr:50S ribosomal protein L25 [Candidatus Binatia bacterium]
MKTVPLTAYPRSLARRAGSKKLRSEGRVPAVIYGRQAKQPQNLEVNVKDIENLIHHSVSENLLVDLQIDKDTRPKRLALVQELQHHPLSGKLLHIDLHEVSESEKVTVMVPVESIGEAAGVKTGGGVLEHVLFKIRVRALPKDLPEYIEVDVSHLEIGQAIHLGDIKAPAGVEILGEKKVSVIACAAPISEAQEAAVLEGATAAAGEVEMIKEKKEEGEAAAAPAGKAGEKGEKGEKAPAAGKPGERAPAGEKGAEKGAAPAAAGEKKPAEKKK